jgi:hypothetical protein
MPIVLDTRETLEKRKRLGHRRTNAEGPVLSIKETRRAIAIRC